MSFDTRLFIGNLPENTTDGDLRSAFSSYGQIVNIELKTKPGTENNTKKFSFITLSSSNHNVESCIRHFSTEDFSGSRLYVTRARESFLERLQRERQQEKEKAASKNEVPTLPEKQPVMKLNEKLNPQKRKFEHDDDTHFNGFSQSQTKRKTFDEPKRQDHVMESNSLGYKKPKKKDNRFDKPETAVVPAKRFAEGDEKKLESDKKRLESMKKKREEFKQKQIIIKTGLVAIDKVPNKKVVFSDSDDEKQTNVSKNVNRKVKTNQQQKGKSLFDNNDEESDEEGDGMNFEIKEQFEGKKGQRVLELQSRYKSDKRFTLDERFVEDNGSEDENKEWNQDQDERFDLGQTDEKYKQLNILQDVLGVPIRTSNPDAENDQKKYKTKLGGMLRFDPSQPDHARFLAPVEEAKSESAKKSRKKKKDKDLEIPTEPPPAAEKVEVSKEQFYKVSETLKAAIEQPTSFSLRSLFSKDEEENRNQYETLHQETDYIPLGKSKEPKVKNPFNPTDKNPFKYDSSDSEAEEEDTTKVEAQEKTEVKAVWKEKLFFSPSDTRLEEGLAFFSKSSNAVPKERRGLKSLMKKRLHNTQRKDQMFKKKIGGRKKMMKKSYRKKS